MAAVSPVESSCPRLSWYISEVRIVYFLSSLANDIDGVKTNSGFYLVAGIAKHALFCPERTIFLCFN